MGAQTKEFLFEGNTGELTFMGDNVYLFSWQGLEAHITFRDEEHLLSFIQNEGGQMTRFVDELSFGD